CPSAPKLLHPTGCDAHRGYHRPHLGGPAGAGQRGGGPRTGYLSGECPPPDGTALSLAAHTWKRRRVNAPLPASRHLLKIRKSPEREPRPTHGRESRFRAGLSH
ncbi:MAG: hypothetical protein AVDCRST_MAG25-3307, partial [uncultured Rubrobacteraceae bacterium]